MKKIISFLLFISLTACTSKDEYENSVADLGLGFVSKEMCSCMFVAEQEEGFCREFVKIKQVSPNINVDLREKSITASLFYIFKRTSQLRGDHQGCQIN